MQNKVIDDSKIKYGFYARYIKRLLDILISFFVLVIFSPIWVLLCVLVRCNLGSPIFFKQVRAGKDEKPFEMIKFRTMSDARDTNGNLLPDEDRFTKFGNFLRSTSLDEIPELINILKGEMSIIGPRPLYMIYLPYYTEEEALRHAVRGGLTGLAQINGRSHCKWDDRFAFDVEYVKNITFLNDAKIVIDTIKKVLGRDDIGAPSVDEELPLNMVRADFRKCSREIGCDFSWPKEAFKNVSGEIASAIYNTPWSKDGATKYFSLARNVLRSIAEKHYCKDCLVLLPAYTCDSVVDPFVESGYQVITYTIKDNLCIDLDDFVNKLSNKNVTAVLLHAYFGFEATIVDAVNVLTNLGKSIVTIDDRTQSVFSKYPIWADYTIGSIRKWGPLPDGAFLCCKNVEDFVSAGEDTYYVNNIIDAMDCKARYLKGEDINKDVFLSDFARLREYTDNQKVAYGISKESLYQFSNLGGEDISKRRFNYQTLLNFLPKCNLYNKVLTDLNESVPFMFPIIVKSKIIEMQTYLAKREIYTTRIWSCPEQYNELIDAKSKKLFNQVLCIPCDQRYNEYDMLRICSEVEGYING